MNMQIDAMTPVVPVARGADFETPAANDDQVLGIAPAPAREARMSLATRRQSRKTLRGEDVAVGDIIPSRQRLEHDMGKEVARVIKNQVKEGIEQLRSDMLTETRGHSVEGCSVAEDIRTLKVAVKSLACTMRNSNVSVDIQEKLNDLKKSLEWHFTKCVDALLASIGNGALQFDWVAPIENLLRQQLQPLRQKLDQHDFDVATQVRNAMVQYRIENKTQFDRVNAGIEMVGGGMKLMNPTPDLETICKSLDALLHKHLDGIWEAMLGKNDIERTDKMLYQHLTSLHEKLDNRKSDLAVQDGQSIDSLLRHHLAPVHQKLDRTCFENDRMNKNLENAHINRKAEIGSQLDHVHKRLDNLKLLSEPADASLYPHVASMHDKSDKTYFERDRANRDLANAHIQHREETIDCVDTLLHQHLSSLHQKLDKKCSERDSANSDLANAHAKQAIDINNSVDALLHQHLSVLHQKLDKTCSERDSASKDLAKAHTKHAAEVCDSVDTLLHQHISSLHQKLDKTCSEKDRVCKDLATTHANQRAEITSQLDNLHKIFDQSRSNIEPVDALLRQHLAPLHQKLDRIGLDGDRLTRAMLDGLANHRTDMSNELDRLHRKADPGVNDSQSVDVLLRHHLASIHQKLDKSYSEGDRANKDMVNAYAKIGSQLENLHNKLDYGRSDSGSIDTLLRLHLSSLHQKVEKNSLDIERVSQGILDAFANHRADLNNEFDRLHQRATLGTIDIQSVDGLLRHHFTFVHQKLDKSCSESDRTNQDFMDALVKSTVEISSQLDYLRGNSDHIESELQVTRASTGLDVMRKPLDELLQQRFADLEYKLGRHRNNFEVLLKNMVIDSAVQVKNEVENKVMLQKASSQQMDADLGMLMRAMEGAFQAQRMDFCGLQKQIADQITDRNIDAMKALERQTLEMSKKVDQILLYDQDIVRNSDTFREQIQAFDAKVGTAFRIIQTSMERLSNSGDAYNIFK